ncbi:hypothetical protein LEP1GSC039_2153 [Leptospira santarosai str. 2000027870]|nr:hypothetical protein LEP1GSC039_2153 [Leptospira santarosai str. 2000027870]
MTRILLFILPISILLLSCVSRLRRPELVGTIVDYDKNPIEGCAVGETSTDRNGKFVLPERRYYEFFFIWKLRHFMYLRELKKKGFIEKKFIILIHTEGAEVSNGI